MISSLHRCKHMWISRGHVRICDSAVAHRRSGRSEVPTPVERESQWAHTHADQTRNGITSESHLSRARWQSSQAHDSFEKCGISWAKESCEFHRGEISLSASQHTHTFGFSCESFADSHSPHPGPTPQVVRAHASESSPPCRVLEPFLALKQHHRRWNKGPHCHPQPMLSAHPALHTRKTPFSNQHHIFCTQKPLTLQLALDKQTKCCRSSICSVIHPSVKTAIITIKKKEFLTIKQRGSVFIFLLTKASCSGCAGLSKGALVQLSVNLVLFQQRLWGWWCSLAGERSSNSSLYTSVEYH